MGVGVLVVRMYKKKRTFGRPECKWELEFGCGNV
jgi:hypothetical protein